MTDKLLKVTGSVWFIPALIAGLLAIMGSIGLAHASRPHPQVITGHQTTEAIVGDRGERESTRLASAFSDDRGVTWWIDVTTSNGRNMACRVDDDTYRHVSTTKTRRMTCLDTNDEPLFTTTIERSA